MDMKPGVKSTEFWLSLATVISLAFGAKGIDPDVMAGAVAGITGIYTWVRGLAKKQK